MMQISDIDLVTDLYWKIKDFISPNKDHSAPSDTHSGNGFGLIRAQSPSVMW